MRLIGELLDRIEDRLRERRIRRTSDEATFLLTTGRKEEAKELLVTLAHLIHSRRPEQVARMERARGLIQP